jgi:4-amino-4-deoxychorismate lyase
MCRLIESLKIQDGKIINHPYHSYRMNESRRILFGYTDPFDIRSIVTVPEACMHGIYKCRIIYADAIVNVTFEKYRRRSISSLKLVYDDTVDYSHKFENKERLQSLLAQSGGCDDILIVKNGELTDTSFSNIALFDGHTWLTPSSPLLKGTKRAQLLALGLIKEERITVANIPLFRQAALINAMLELGDTVFPAQDIH